MKKLFVALVVVTLASFAPPAFAEVTSETVEWVPPADCGAPYVESMEECGLCHLADPPEAVPATSAMEASEASSLTYKTIVSSDQRIIAEIPAETVQPNQEFNHFILVTPYIMTYQYGYAYGSTFQTVDYKWPWGSTNLNFPYPDLSHSIPGKYEYEVRIIYCSSGAPVCGHGWLQTTLKWTVTVAESSITYFNQSDPLWGSQQYDNMDTTIAAKGCCLTSAAMVLLYHGIDQGVNGSTTDPGTLNNFLNSYVYTVWNVTNNQFEQDNGYTDAGAMRHIPHIEEFSRPSFLSTFIRISYSETPSSDASSSPSYYCTYQSAISEREICAEMNQTIDQQLDDDNPVILKVRGTESEIKTHYLVAYAKSAVGATPTLAILDPNHEEYEKLYNTHYQNKYKGIRIYQGGIEPKTPKLVVFLGSPAVFEAVDSFDRRTGIDPSTGELLREIPNSNILDESVESEHLEWVLYLDDPTEGTYRFYVTGTEEGPYSLDFFHYQPGYPLIQAVRYEGTISPAREYSYLLDLASAGDRIIG